jgi:hypothetical protein
VTVLVGDRAGLVGIEVEQRHARDLVGHAEVVNDRGRDRSRRAEDRNRHPSFSHCVAPYRRGVWTFCPNQRYFVIHLLLATSRWSA